MASRLSRRNGFVQLLRHRVVLGEAQVQRFGNEHRRPRVGFHRRPVQPRDQPVEQVNPQLGVLLKILRRTGTSASAAIPRWRPRSRNTGIEVVLGADDALRRQELLQAQVIEGGAIVRPRQQQAGAGQQFFPAQQRTRLGPSRRAGFSSAKRARICSVSTQLISAAGVTRGGSLGLPVCIPKAIASSRRSTGSLSLASPG